MIIIISAFTVATLVGILAYIFPIKGVIVHKPSTNDRINNPILEELKELNNFNYRGKYDKH